LAVAPSDRAGETLHFQPFRELAELTFDHHERHPEFLRLVAIENTHRAEHIARSSVLTSLNTRAVDLIARILERGRAEGVIRRDVDPLDVHMLISAFCVFRVANKHTFKAIFGRDLRERSRRPRYRKMLGEVVVAYLTTSDAPVDQTRRSLRSTARRSAFPSVDYGRAFSKPRAIRAPSSARE
jgi:hypothetical protein